MPGALREERGAAVADFAMVSVLVLAIVLALLQLGLALHARNTLISCASEGARAGARADAVPGQAVARTQELVSASLSPRYARSVSSREAVVDGVRVVEVRVVAPVPVLGLLGPEGSIDVVGRAFAEDQ
ncbi:TadE/TadG family type IV pilus assembly protein [Phycicoccus sp. HDW14]|uniref:TadE/TadG family type IV pilus assembly protein n=1 Tax=Phycicoccus sp. HDW14 TaxID=2714941 RepID=UPI001F0F5622|nr:TadE/TadG family type IV pilus assembly protein [Phycicoccus sp. HDW14]